jgi:chemotaxis protein methyltransferase CheR
MKARTGISSIVVGLPKELSPKAFEEIRELVYRHSGIALGDNKQPLVKARIQKRMRTLGIDTYEEYVEAVRTDKNGEELQQLLEAISTNVTSFYREKHHFAFMRAVLDEWTGAGRGKLRVWSAACSTGEEPYTIAMEILDAIGNHRWDVKILATDLATKVLRDVQTGIYSREKVEPVPAILRQRYLSRVSGQGTEQYAVSDQLKQLLLIRQFNLTHFPYAVTGPMDMVFCRNVMIYFDRPTRAKIIHEFSRIVRPGGYLFVGHSESLSGMSAEFQLVRPSVYRRG